MAGDAKVASQTFPTGLLERLQGATLHGDRVQFIHRRDGMTLIEVKRLRLQAFQRALHFIPGTLSGAFGGLAPQKETLSLAWHPWTNAFLCLSIGRRDIDVVDARLDDL